MDKKKLEDLRSFVEELASENDFETMHFEDVEKNILYLAELRNLDIMIAELTAWLHDIARIKYGFRGKKHAKEGKKEAKEILEKLNFDEKTIEIVVGAIGNHRKKGRIDDEYSELIKDADCLSHNKEFDGEIDALEKTRCRFAEKGECRLLRCKDIDTIEMLKEKWGDLESLLEETASGDADSKMVHETRICIRKIRAILKTMNSISVKPFEDDLKKLFKKYSDLRECHVLKQNVIKVGKMKWFEDRLESIHDHMLVELKEQIESLYNRNGINEMRQKLINIMKAEDSSIVGSGQVMKRYADGVRKAEMDNVDTLHRLRIRGKAVKYLVDLGLFEMDEECRKLVKSMHSEIGKLHDIHVNRRLVNESKYAGNVKLNDKEMKRIKEYFCKMEEKANLKTANGLFELKLRFRTRTK
ncbi:MAG TPA: CHAD domain-containing protein [Clostridia bacterium]|nr:CHAD domain-containing protein [Clostridia bacterium]